MSTKDACIERMKTMLEEKGLSHFFLDKPVHTNWPDQKEKEYMIYELVLNKDGKIQVWQGPAFKFQNRVFYLEDFDSSILHLVEEELKRSIDLIKEFRVQVISYVDVKATSPENAQNLVSSYRFNSKEHLLWIELGNKVEEL